ncbi:chemotaxis-specific protein-glutamate methyltransferase CheB [Pseudomonas schmalbachii]|uniref:Protein-glutamate methylesterase/protein-glutamine glutaminase n=1 Tax=Pseudomonas schmalbachii TaxID=2816993 RepID=A0ABS3TMC4_9PSED|nr:chemotaxis-specific protein-glutamate methyltransferase CheB [Pseudomonas schmalbachii]MBO3274811.1 chemotaxis-specific protein-glutamate methyltransferase CheB [Pseudomonas schmalbachii]
MRIAIASDKPAVVADLRRLLAGEPAHHVLWVAADGVEAVERCALQAPDVLLLDLDLAPMGGVEATRLIMQFSPCAIMLVAADLEQGTSRVFEAMGHGAVDAMQLPAALAGNPGQTLLRKLRNLAWLNAPDDSRPGAAWSPRPVLRPASRLVAIGASAGGPAALAELFAGLPESFSAAIVVVQHVEDAFTRGMADWLTTQSPIPVRLARGDETPQPGSILLAGGSNHLRLLKSGELNYSEEPCSHVYRPSIDVFFESVAQNWTGEAVGVLLTGMGRDGAQGLKLMRKRGFLTLAQDEGSCAVYGMPKAAAALGAAAEIRPLGEIARRLCELYG